MVSVRVIFLGSFLRLFYFGFNILWAFLTNQLLIIIPCSWNNYKTITRKKSPSEANVNYISFIKIINKDVPFTNII